jgi:MFS family permease
LWSAVVVFAVATGGYLSLPSRRYNPDGLRVFPGLHQVVADSTGEVTFVPLSWATGYQAPHYFRANVQKHFLFPLYAFAGYRVARWFGWSGSGLRPLQILNALAAGVAIGLFGLLAWQLLAGRLLVLVLSLGLACSVAFSSMATNIAEVVPALPGLMLSLVILARRDETDPRTALLAGLLLGVSAGFYLVTGAVGLALAAWLALRRRPGCGLLLFGTMAAVVLASYLGVLVAAGYRTMPQLAHALFFMPEQGTYGGLKATNLVTVWLGFANSVFPVLPDDFSGLRGLLSTGGSGWRFYSRVVVLPLVTVLSVGLFAALVRSRRRLTGPARRLVGLGLAVFLGPLGASLVWDPYHPKFWVFSNVGLWLMTAGYLAHIRSARRTGLVAARVLPAEILLALGLFTVVSINLARRITEAGPNPHEAASRAIARQVNTRPGSIVLGGWEFEFDYLVLLVPEPNQLCLPDAILEQRRDPSRVRNLLGLALGTTRAQGGKVLVLNQFNRTPAELNAFYARRLQFPAFPEWLEIRRSSAEPIWRDSLTGSVLYALAGLESPE